MGKGKTKSKLKLSQRRERAFELFARGYTNTAVAEDLHVSMPTAAEYRKYYNERIHAQAAANPNFFAETVDRTMQSLEELDLIRADAWAHLENRLVKQEHTCPKKGCGHKWKTKEEIPVPDQTRAQYHNVLLKAQDQRSKLFGVLGVKQEMLAEVMRIQYVQGRVIEWLSENLEGAERERLAEFLVTELGEFMGGNNGGGLEATPEAIEMVSRA